MTQPTAPARRRNYCPAHLVHALLKQVDLVAITDEKGRPTWVVMVRGEVQGWIRKGTHAERASSYWVAKTPEGEKSRMIWNGTRHQVLRSLLEDGCLTRCD